MNDWKTQSPHDWIKRAESNPTPGNDNLRLCPSWMTPAELLQWIIQEKEQMRRELAANFQLRSDPNHRRIWANLEAMERCTRQRCYGEA